MNGRPIVAFTVAEKVPRAVINRTRRVKKNAGRFVPSKNRNPFRRVRRAADKQIKTNRENDDNNDRNEKTDRISGRQNRSATRRVIIVIYVRRGLRINWYVPSVYVASRRRRTGAN